MSDAPEKHAVITQEELDTIYSTMFALRRDLVQWCRLEELEESARTPHPNGFAVSRQILQESTKAFLAIRSVRGRMETPSAHQRLAMAAARAKQEVAS
jgi:hypothetical protein